MVDYSSISRSGTRAPLDLYATSQGSAYGATPGDLSTQNWSVYTTSTEGEPFERVDDSRAMIQAFKIMMGQFQAFFNQSALAFVAPMIDGFLGDLESMLQPSRNDTALLVTGSRTLGMSSDRALQIIYGAFDDIKTSDVGVTYHDLLAAAEPDSKVSAEVRAAVVFLLSEPTLLRSADTARQDNAGAAGATPDMIFVRDDFIVTMDRSALSGGDRAALQTLKNNAEELFAESEHMSREELETLATTGKLPSGEEASSGVVAAAKRLVDSPAFFDRLDSAVPVYNGERNATLDRSFSIRDIDKLLEAPLGGTK